LKGGFEFPPENETVDLDPDLQGLKYLRTFICTIFSHKGLHHAHLGSVYIRGSISGQLKVYETT